MFFVGHVNSSSGLWIGFTNKSEQRTDGKPSPFVGAVLVRPDGSIETAARGELREGNHAEHTESTPSSKSLSS